MTASLQEEKRIYRKTGFEFKNPLKILEGRFQSFSEALLFVINR